VEILVSFTGEMLEAMEGEDTEAMLRQIQKYPPSSGPSTTKNNPVAWSGHLRELPLQADGNARNPGNWLPTNGQTKRTVGTFSQVISNQQGFFWSLITESPLLTVGTQFPP